MVMIPTVPVDPAGLQTAAAQLRTGGAAIAEQADTVVRTWSGLDPYYDAPEAPALLDSLDPVTATAHAEQAQLAAVGRTLDFLAEEARATITELNMLRAQAATASPAAAALLEERALALIAQLHQVEQACATAIRATVGQAPVLARPAGVPSALSYLALLAGDHTPGLGSSYLDTQLESAMLTHFTDGSGSEYVLSRADLAMMKADPAVLAAGRAIRAGVPGTATPVTLEGGLPGFRADVDFKKPIPGRAINPFDGSIGRGRVFFDAGGNPVGISDAYDFTNPGNAVDLVNLDAGLFGSTALRGPRRRDRGTAPRPGAAGVTGRGHGRGTAGGAGVRP